MTDFNIFINKSNIKLYWTVNIVRKNKNKQRRTINLKHQLVTSFDKVIYGICSSPKKKKILRYKKIVYRNHFSLMRKYVN